MKLSQRIGLLSDRLYQNQRERDTVFKGDFGALSCGLRKTKQYRISYSPNGRIQEFVLITLKDKQLSTEGPVATLISRLDSGTTKLDGRVYAPERKCFVCHKASDRLTWTNLPLQDSPRVQLLVFTCSENCIQAIRHVSMSVKDS